MGNSSTKESRSDQRSNRASGSSEPGQSTRVPGSSTRARTGRSDLPALLGLASASSGSALNPGDRRESRQEREARRLERERQQRLVERERSMREEHVDGGYLVTLGTYIGVEDFNKTIVRQLQVDRKLAPFWRGLQDFSDTWTEYQIVAAARGLEVPPPDVPPPDGFLPRPPSASTDPVTRPAGSQGLHQGQSFLTVPGSGQGFASAGSTPAPAAANTSASIPTGSLAGTSSPSAPTPAVPASPRVSSSPFKPRAKAFAAALSVSSRNGSSTDLTPRETALPHDPFVNGQPIEVFLYKNATECPICFLTYPPYLNHTRCCDQPICSECFVQIKRADPHYPEGHGDTPSADVHPEEQAGQLISEPSCCPYCQQPEFGVTYEPPPFRRGLAHGLQAAIGTLGTAMSSTSSINSTALSSPTLNLPPPAGGTGTSGRRRTQSLSATAPNVVTTDRIRPDWAAKLANQRAHIARRAAAATALHTAAFLMGNNTEQRSFRVSRITRWGTGSHTLAGGAASPAQAPSDTAEGGEGGNASASTMEPGPRSSSGRGAASSGGRRNRMEDLEELMFREALRQSLATEEERRRKEEKEERKETKRREKEERKAAKASAKQGGSSSLYVAGSSQSSASASSLSLSGIVGRRRGNSGASHLRVEASVAHANAVAIAVGGGGGGSGSGSGSGSGGSSSADVSGSSSPVASSSVGPGSTSGGPASTSDKGKSVDRGVPGADAEADATTATTSVAAPRLIATPQPSAGPSHLRQMSSASSVSSSLQGSTTGSYQNPALLVQDPQESQDPRGSGLSLGSRSAASEDGEHVDERDPSNSAEPMFNFSSLAELVGVQLEGEHAGRRLSAIGRDKDSGSAAGAAGPDAFSGGLSGLSSVPKEVEEPRAEGEHIEVATGPTAHESPQATPQQRAEVSKTTPEVLITPGTPSTPDEFE